MRGLPLTLSLVHPIFSSDFPGLFLSFLLGVFVTLALLKLRRKTRRIPETF